MTTITIPVSTELAKMYEGADEAKKEKAQLHVNAWLSYFLKSESVNDRLFEIMREASKIAKKNGLTPEILEDLLKDEE